MTCLMKANGMNNVYEVYLFEVFQEMSMELGAQRLLYVIRDMITLPR